MSDPIQFDTASPRFALPLLWSGQAQKEFYVNEAHALTDALLHCAIEGEAAAPPATPVEGTNWLVSASPSGAWSGQAGKLACRQAGNWLFVTPRDGMRLLDRANGQEIRYFSGWQTPARPAAPSGGTTIDAEARSAIAAILATMEMAGIVPPP
jgi:hypothetical protein